MNVTTNKAESNLQSEIEWSVRYLSVYNVSRNSASYIVTNIVRNLSSKSNMYSDRTLIKDMFKIQLEREVAKLKVQGN